MSDRIVLAYSGGLDTSVCIGWLRRQAEKWWPWPSTSARARTWRSSANALWIVGRRGRRGRCQGRVRRGLLPASAARQRALHGSLPMVSALSRPLIVRHLAEAARVTGQVVSHGCTGKGNDQVRFEVGIANRRQSWR